ncbi:MAG: hypothetical protein CL681_20170 [Blastopirellula sp.]|nr:hypothetical protein [Blastopirellula sp.]
MLWSLTQQVLGHESLKHGFQTLPVSSETRSAIAFLRYCKLTMGKLRIRACCHIGSVLLDDLFR